MSKKHLIIIALSIVVICLISGIFIYYKDMDSVETEQFNEYIEDNTEAPVITEAPVEESTSEETDTTAGGSMGSEDVPEGDELTQANKDAEEEANAADEGLNESTGIEIVEELDKDMYAIKNCNLRNGDGTNYEKIGSLEYLSKPHVTGKTANGWYRIVWGDGEAYVSADFLSDTKPESQPSGGGNTNTETPSNPSGGGSSSGSGAVTDDSVQDILDNIFGEGTGATGGNNGSYGGY